MIYTFHDVGIDEIDLDDTFYRLRPPIDDPRLADSISQIGITEPPYLHKHPGVQAWSTPETTARNYRLVSGFNRVRAAAAAGLHRLPAFLLPEEWSDLQVYRWLLQKESALKPLSPLEASFAIATLVQGLTRTPEEITETWLPLMGLAAHPSVFALYAPLHTLEHYLQQALAADELHVEVACLLTVAEPEERSTFWRLNQQLRLGKNRQREYWRLLADISKIIHQSLPQLIEHPACKTLLDDRTLTFSQKSDRFKALLMQWRYPEYSATLSQFETLVHAAKLPPQIHLHPTPWFAGEEYFVDFSFTSSAEFSARLEILQKMLAQGTIDKLVTLT